MSEAGVYRDLSQMALNPLDSSGGSTPSTSSSRHELKIRICKGKDDDEFLTLIHEILGDGTVEVKMSSVLVYAAQNEITDHEEAVVETLKLHFPEVMQSLRDEQMVLEEKGGNAFENGLDGQGLIEDMIVKENLKEVHVVLAPRMVEFLTARSKGANTILVKHMDRKKCWAWRPTYRLSRNKSKSSVGRRRSSSFFKMDDTEEEEAKIRSMSEGNEEDSEEEKESSYSPGLQIFDMESTDRKMDLELIREALVYRWHYTPDEANTMILAGIEPDTEGTDLIGEEKIRLINERLHKLLIKVKDNSVHLSPEAEEAIKLVFPFSCRVELELLCGGFSGAKVFRCSSFDPSGNEEIPSVAKTDHREHIRDEHVRMMKIAPLLGENAPKILAIADYMDLGVLRIELCGATWGLPHLESEKFTISTFKDLYVEEVNRLITACRMTTSSVKIKRQPSMAGNGAFHLKRQGSGINWECLQKNRETHHQPLFDGPVVGEIETVLGEVFGTILHTGAVEKCTFEQASIFDNGGFPLDNLIERHIKENNDPAVRDMIQLTSGEVVKNWTGIPNLNPLRFFEMLLAAIKDPRNRKGVLKRRLMGFVHGDLNGSNILIDQETIVWLIDFAFSGLGPILQDIAKLENTILFEYTPLMGNNSVKVQDFEKVLSVLVHSDLNELPPIGSLGINYNHPCIAAIEQAWNAIGRTRQYARLYCKPDSDPMYLHAGRVFYAIKTLAFRDVSLEQKRMALLAAYGHGAKILQLISPSLCPSPTKTSICSSSFKSSSDKSMKNGETSAMENGLIQKLTYHAQFHQILLRERVKYMSSVVAKEAYFVDPVSQLKLSVLKQCVNLVLQEVKESKEDSDGKVLSFQIDKKSMDNSNIISDLNDAMSTIKRCATAIRGLVGESYGLETVELLEFFERAEVRQAINTLGLVSFNPKNFVQDLLSDFGQQNKFIFADELEHCLVKRIITSQATTGNSNYSLLSSVYVTYFASCFRSPYFERVNELLPSGLDLHEDRRIIVLGSPAAGKSVLMRKMLVLGGLKQSYRKAKLNEMYIPLRVLLIDMGRLVTKYELTEKDDLLTVYLEEKYGATTSKYLFLRRALATGRVILLLDGFDEAGTSGGVIMRWLVQYLDRRADQRVIISSREVGFGEYIKFFEARDFKTLKVQPLTYDLIDEVVEHRLRHIMRNRQVSEEDELDIAYVKSQLRLKEYASLAQNPLMLSLLIHVLASSKRQSANLTETEGSVPNNVMTKSKLFACAIQQMLRRGDVHKYKRHKGVEDKQIESDLGLLEDPIAMKILQDVALLAHCRHNRDISLEEFAEVIHNVTDDSRYLNRFVTVYNGLQRSIARNHVSLFQTREVRNAGQDERLVMFSHLALQEYLSAECIVNKIEANLQKGVTPIISQSNVAKIVYDYFGGTTLENPWWYNVFCVVVDILHERQMIPALRAVFHWLFVANENHFATQRALINIWLAVSSGGDFLTFMQLLEMRDEIQQGNAKIDVLTIKDTSNNSCLHLMAEHNRFDMLKYCINRLQKVDKERLSTMLNELNSYSWDPANSALCKNNLQCHRILIVTNGDHDKASESQDKLPEIVKFVKNGDYEKAEALLKKNPVLGCKAKGSTGITCAMWAAINDDVDMLDLFVKYDTEKAYEHTTSRRGNTILAFAVENNSIACVEYLLEKGLSALWKNSNDDSLLLVSTSFGYNEVANLLIQHGAEAAEALVVSAIQGRDEFVKALIKMATTSFPDVDVVNKVVELGVTPVAAACVAGHASTLKILIQNGANVNHPIDVPFGSSSIHIAVQNGHLDCVEVLLFHGANVNSASPKESAAGEGKTALLIAEGLGQSHSTRAAIIDLLKRKGAKKWIDMTEAERITNTQAWYDIFRC